MDPVVPQLEAETRRRRRALMFRHRQIPVRMMVPNFVTLLGLCAGLTSIRMSIEGRWELALAAIVFAALLDGVDGRVARLLKASSRFGAELDSLADFVNFGVAPAILIFTWALGDLKSLGWICVLLFALASALRLARFNVAIDDDKPKWQSNYFSGMPTPAAAIAVLLPTYLDNLGFSEIRTNHFFLHLVLGYTVFIAIMMVSSIPTYSGKLLHERISRELVLPIFVAAVALVALLVTYPYGTLTVITLAYLASIPLTYRAFMRKEAEMTGKADISTTAETSAGPDMTSSPMPAAEASAAPSSMRVVDIRPLDPKR
ncbi:MAG: CDP-diacylglycerol--serine O-phosphatidyltransferase [Hyphomicrobiaceae bacterium]